MRISQRFSGRMLPGVLALLIGMSLAWNTLAEDKGDIKFEKGKTSASVKGEIQGMDRDTYTLQAKAGQEMTVKVTNAKKLVLFQIQIPGDEETYLPGAGLEDDAVAWEGKLPKDGKYTIIVGAMQGEDTKYVLDVAIKAIKKK